MSIPQIPNSVNTYQKMAGLTQTTSEKTQIDYSSISQGKGELKVDQMTIRNEKQASLVAHLFGNGETQNAENGLKMTYQAAIDKLNEKFKAELGDAYGDNAITQENLDKRGIEYWNPENTSARIVNSATAFLSGFQTAHPELQGEELMNKFLEVVGGGLQQGFDEAQGILSDLKVFDGLVKDNFSATTDLVQKGMENFKNQYLGIAPEPTSEEANQTE